MKKLFLFAVVLLAGKAMIGQVIIPSGTILVPTAPSGACSNSSPGQLVTLPGSTGGIWTCGGAGTPNVWGQAASGGGGSGVTNVATSGPITGGPITTTGTIGCSTCGVTGNPLSQFAATTSAQFFGVISDETGTGVVVGNNGPTLIAPALGTPASALLTNATGLPLSTGVTGALPNANLANPATTVNGQTCTLGSTCTVTSNTPNAVTFAATGGASPGSTYNGGATLTVSPVTIGAAASGPNGDITSMTAVTSLAPVSTINGPASGTGTLTVTAGTSTGSALLGVGSSGGTGFNEQIGSQAGLGEVLNIGGTTVGSSIVQEPDSGQPNSICQVALAAGGGTGTGDGQTSHNCTGTTTSNGYFNPVTARFSLRNSLLATPATSSLFENGAEGCATSTAGIFTAPCGSFGTAIHWYWFVFTSPTTGFGLWDCIPGSGNQSAWTAANSVCNWKVPINMVFAPTIPLAGLLFGNTSTAVTAATSSQVATALGGYATVANTTVAVSSGTQGANSCSSPTTVTMTGLTTSMVPLPGYSSNPGSLTGWGSSGGMVFQAWPSAANTLSWAVCNQTSASITFSAITFNVGAR